MRALLSSVAIGVIALPISAGAQVSAPTADKPWGGCLLSATAIAALADDIGVDPATESLPQPNTPVINENDVMIDAVIVLRLGERNWGQPISTRSGNTLSPTGGVTARILCSAVDEVAEVREDDATGEIDILNADETLAIRADRLTSGAPDGASLARLCLTSNTTTASTDLEVDPVTCFRLVLEPMP